MLRRCPAQCDLFPAQIMVHHTCSLPYIRMNALPRLALGSALASVRTSDFICRASQIKWGHRYFFESSIE